MVCPNWVRSQISLRGFLKDPRTFDAVNVVLSTGLVLGAYITAYAYVHIPGAVEAKASQAGFIIVEAAWALLTVFLFGTFARGLRAGRSWNRAMPDGYVDTLLACLAFGYLR
jgi:hypothetical protein